MYKASRTPSMTSSAAARRLRNRDRQRLSMPRRCWWSCQGPRRGPACRRARSRRLGRRRSTGRACGPVGAADPARIGPLTWRRRASKAALDQAALVGCTEYRCEAASRTPSVTTRKINCHRTPVPVGFGIASYTQSEPGWDSRERGAMDGRPTRVWAAGAACCAAGWEGRCRRSTLCGVGVCARQPHRAFGAGSLTVARGRAKPS